MNYYLISIGHREGTERSFTVDNDRAVVIRAESKTQAISIACDLMVIADASAAEAHEVRFPNPDLSMS